MKAAVIVRPGQLEIQEIPVPGFNDYQVLVEQLACGICTGTDWKLLEGHFKGFATADLSLFVDTAEDMRLTLSVTNLFNRVGEKYHGYILPLSVNDAPDVGARFAPFDGPLHPSSFSSP